MQEKWAQLKKDMKNEYDLIVQMHSTLIQLDDNTDGGTFFGAPEEIDYGVEGFAPKLKKTTSE